MDQCSRLESWLTEPSAPRNTLTNSDDWSFRTLNGSSVGVRLGGRRNFLSILPDFVGLPGQNFGFSIKESGKGVPWKITGAVALCGPEKFCSRWADQSSPRVLTGTLLSEGDRLCQDGFRVEILNYQQWTDSVNENESTVKGGTCSYIRLNKFL